MTLDPLFSALASLLGPISSQEMAFVYYSYLYEYALLTPPPISQSYFQYLLLNIDLKTVQSKDLPYFELHMVPQRLHANSLL